jgi:NAD(P)-dependent dehydrogenase (short-subunit alcohol dehydrogenase family)
MAERLDVTDEVLAREVVGKALARFGHIDLLVNNAGKAISGVVEELGDRELREVMDANFFGAATMMRLAAKAMRERGTGIIVNVSSIAGRMATAFNGAYSASKFALEALSDAARQELAPFGVRVVLIEPGPIATEFDATNTRGSSDTVGNPDSPYAFLYRAAQSVQASFRKGEPGPEAVVRVLLKAIKARRPKARYLVAVPAAARLAMSMGDGVRDAFAGMALARRG